MLDSAAARRMMVDGQVRTADVTSPDLIAAMLEVPREKFVPPAVAELAYLDGEIKITARRALLRPMILAKLIQAARVTGEQHVLDVACGLGYSSAVLARLAGSVVALEDDAELAGQAKAALAANGAAQVMVVTGPLNAGWPGAGPYDLILVNGAVEAAPEALGKQLKSDGRLACVLRRSAAAKAMIYRRIEGQLVGRPIFDAPAPLLPEFAAPQTFVF